MTRKQLQYFEKLRKRGQAKQDYELIRHELWYDKMNGKITNKQFDELTEIAYQECKRKEKLYA